MSAVCRSCDAPIFWAVTTTGKTMPVDAEPVPDGNVVLVEQEGDWTQPMVRVLGKDESTDEDRYVSHFVTCPQREKWRKK